MNHLFTAALILWVISGVAYRKARRKERFTKSTIWTLPSVEDQLDIDIHTREISERPHFKQGSWELTS